MNRKIFLLIVLVFGLAGCGPNSSSFVITSSDGKVIQKVELQGWLKEHPLPADKEIAVYELGRTEKSSCHLVQIRTREKLHIHKKHDGVATAVAFVVFSPPFDGKDVVPVAEQPHK